MRRVMHAWLAAAAQLAAERQDENEQLCKLRIQEARKMEIASRFNHLWHLHCALRTWASFTKDAASTRAAEMHAAREAAAMSARLEIAAQFHLHYTMHAVLRQWRHAALALRQEREAGQQAKTIQSRIDAVLALVKAAQREGKLPWGTAKSCASNAHDAAVQEECGISDQQRTQAALKVVETGPVLSVKRVGVASEPSCCEAGSAVCLGDTSAPKACLNILPKFHEAVQTSVTALRVAAATSSCSEVEEDQGRCEGTETNLSGADVPGTGACHEYLCQ
jgi:hypothetical protein